MDKLNIYSVNPNALNTIQSIEEIPELALSSRSFNWLFEAEIYNKNDRRVWYEWLMHNADVIVLLFTLNNADRKSFMENFGKTYEEWKQDNIPIEVINVPMDDNEEESKISYEKQANWFTLKFNHILIPTLKLMLEVTRVPQMRVFMSNGELISRDGMADFEEYGKNAVISWLTTPCNMKTHRNFEYDKYMYGPTWKYLEMQSYIVVSTEQH